MQLLPAHSQCYIEYTQNNNTQSLVSVIKVKSSLFPSWCRWSCLFCLSGFTFCGSLCASLITPLRLRWAVSYDRSQQTDLLQNSIYYVAEQYDQYRFDTTTRLSWTFSLFSICLFTVHRTRRKKTLRCSPATSESSWPSKCRMINARLLWMFLTQNFLSVLVGRWTCRSKTCPLMTLRLAYRTAHWAYMIIAAS